MGFQFCQVRDVADVIAFSRLLAIISNDLASGDFLHECNRLENRDAVFASAPQVIDLGRPWILNEFFDGADGIVTVDVVANLFTLISKNRVGLPAHRYSHQMRKETMQLDTGMLRTRDTTSPKYAYAKAKISCVLLRVDICSRFGSPEERVQCSINPARFIDPLIIGGIRIIVSRG